MMRGLSLLATFGFGGIFLTISPNLRGVASGVVLTGLNDLDKYSPWSYVGCGVAGLLLITVMLNTGSRPR